MKDILLLICIYLFCCTNTLAQLSPSIRVKSGENLYEKLAEEIYLYPAFIKGTILFKNGKLNLSSFNYNLLFGEMQFIGIKGDTLSVADTDSIKYVSISRDTFFFKEGCLQLILENNTAKLAVKQIIKVVGQEKIGAYDQPSSTGAITSYEIFSNNLQSFKLDVRRDLILNKKTTFYIGDRHNNFLQANKKNIFKTFPDKQKELNLFLRENKINFNNGEDLITLIAFLKDY